QAVVLEEEDLPALAIRGTVPREVPELGQPRAYRLPFRDRSQVLERDGVLGRDPLRGFRRVRVLQPAVRVGDPRAMVVVDYVYLLGLGIADRLSGQVRGRERCGDDQRIRGAAPRRRSADRPVDGFRPKRRTLIGHWHPLAIPVERLDRSGTSGKV